MQRAGVERAARNNAWWCHAVSAAAGLTGTFRDDAWTCARRTPDLFPDAVTLDAAASPEALLPHVDATAGCSVKDSFATLDLAPFGFEVLFDARWIRRAAGPVALPLAPIEWRELEPGDSDAWARACRSSGGPLDFDPRRVPGEHTEILIGWRAGEPVAGAVATRAAGVVGLSNLFGPPGCLDAAWSGCAHAVHRRDPHVDIVGYEWGESLVAARACGFADLGPLRIWHIPKERPT